MHSPSAMQAWRLRPSGDPNDARAVDRMVVRRAIALARPYRGLLAGFLGTLVVTAVLSVQPPLIIGQVIDQAIPNRDTALLTNKALFLVGIGVAIAGISLITRWLSATIGERLILDLRTMLFRHVQSMPIAFFTRTQTGALITRLNNDVVGAQRALTGTLGGIVDNGIGVATTLVVMLALDWRVTLIALALLPLFLFPSRIVGRRLQGLSRRGMALNAEMNTTMTERFNVSGAMLVKLFGVPDRELDAFHDRADRVAAIGVRQAMLMRYLFVSLGLIGSLATAVVYFTGGNLVISDPDLEVGQVVALALLVTNLYGPLAQLSNARVEFLTAMVSFERVFEVLDLEQAITDAPDAVPLTSARGHVEFDDVWFRYPAAGEGALASLEGVTSAHGDDASDWILRGVTLDAPAGTMVALVGPSGAGKTSMSQLVPRLYDVTEGAVRIDGHDVRDVSLASLGHAVGVVSQDPHLFHDTLAANLRYAKPDATDQELVAAATAARIHAVIARLPDGYDTVVGDRGYRLSGGEKQRVAIARVILKNPAVVILDEATAHLDSESERLVQEALREILRDRTSVVIAHRLSTIVDADVILVLRDGEVVERGTHPQLIAANGLYAELARTQLAAPAGS